MGSFLDVIYIFSIPAIVSISSWPIAFFVGSKLNIIDYPNHRKIHKSPVLRTGGILILLGFISGIFTSRIHLFTNFSTITSFATSLFALGLINDILLLNAKIRLILQGVIAYLCISVADVALKDIGLFALPDFIQIPFTIFAIVGVINAYNFVDGLNCLSSGLGIIAASFLGILAYQHNDYELFRLVIIFTGALTSFIVLNSRGKIFMGDSGSYLIGFMISVLSIMLVKRNPAVSPFAPLLITFIPIFDTLFAIYRRRRLKRDPFKADKRHLHHILRRRYNSDTRAVFIILSIQIIIALFATLLHNHTIFLVGLTVLIAMFLRRLWLRKISLGSMCL
jgi:UDP-GlcNAc:undecaprenyl-phosphate GlcNAc-1-phosphate transferase